MKTRSMATRMWAGGASSTPTLSRPMSRNTARSSSGSAAAVYAFHGWDGLSLLGGALALIALAVYATEFQRRSTPVVQPAP